MVIREPEGTRTPNLLIRSQVHYPIMLRVLFPMQRYSICNDLQKLSLINRQPWGRNMRFSAREVCRRPRKKGGRLCRQPPYVRNIERLTLIAESFKGIGQQRYRVFGIVNPVAQVFLDKQVVEDVSDHLG
jgi:hypothetical protein